MNRRKVQKAHSRSNARDKGKILSPNILKIGKVKVVPNHKEAGNLQKKLQSKAQSKLNEGSDNNSLFISLQDLGIQRKQQQKNKKWKKKKVNLPASNKMLEESTASRQFKYYLKQYNSPNGEYFGSRLSSIEHRIIPKKETDKNKNTIQHRKARSLQKKIREYRKLSNTHRSQSESLKSEISDKQMHRLKKIQSLEKMMLMEEILSMEEKRLNIKPYK